MSLNCREIFSAAKRAKPTAGPSSLATAAISHRQANVPSSTVPVPELHLISADNRPLGLAWHVLAELGLAELGCLDAHENVAAQTRDSGSRLFTSAHKLKDTVSRQNPPHTPRSTPPGRFGDGTLASSPCPAASNLIPVQERARLGPTRRRHSETKTALEGGWPAAA